MTQQGVAVDSIAFDYGLTTAYGSNASASPASLVSGTGTTAVSANLGSLTCNTTYHYRLKASNSQGTAYGSDASFMTSPCSTGPVVATGAASGVSQTGATLNGSVTDVGHSVSGIAFEWGSTTSYGSNATASPATISATPGMPTTVTPTATLIGLSCGNTYQYRIMATDASATNRGGNQSFSTSACTSQAITFNTLADKTVGDADFLVSATGGASGTPVTFASQPAGQCTLTDNGNSTATVHLAARGTCTLRASQAGDATYAAAAGVDRSFFVYQNVGLNDSGQTLCYDGAGATVACTSATRQDGRYGRDAASPAKLGGGAAGFDYTALDTNGNPTTASSGATPHPCVRDNVTGLVWEVKTNDGGLHDQDWTYSWYSTEGATNGGDVGSASGGGCNGVAAGCDSEKYVAAVNAAEWCGYSDWRMPTRKELAGLVHNGAVGPSIESTWFPNTQLDWYWTGSTYVPYPANAWAVVFGNGGFSSGNKAYSAYVRLVRGGQ